MTKLYSRTFYSFLYELLYDTVPTENIKESNWLKTVSILTSIRNGRNK